MSRERLTQNVPVWGAAWLQTEASDGADIHRRGHSPIQVEVGASVSGGPPELAKGTAADARNGTGHPHRAGPAL